MARAYEATLPLLLDADLHAAPISLDLEQTETKKRQGIPLLVDRYLAIDVSAARELMITLADASIEKKRRIFPLHLPWTENAPDDHAAAKKIRTALNEGRLDTGRILMLTAAGDHDAVSAAAAEQGLDPGLVRLLAQDTLKPALREWCRQLSPLANGVPWHKNICFVCGAPATLAELQGNEQKKHLRCEACGADWQVNRLQCVHCGNEDHKTQHSLYAEGRRDTVRIEACDVCKGYIKVIASFSPTPWEMLPVEDLTTRHLDALAREHGYSRVGKSNSDFESRNAE
jgi:FdhE protein